MEPNKNSSPAATSTTSKSDDAVQPAPTNHASKTIRGIAVADAVALLRSAFDEADTGSGQDRKGRKDGALDVFEAANCAVLMQNSKLQPSQVKLLSQLKAEDKVRIDDLMKPFEEGLNALDSDKDGWISPAEIEKTKNEKNDGKKKEFLAK